MKTLLVGFSLGLSALLAAACGGDTGGAPRPEPVECQPILPINDFPDPGSGPVDCHALDGYEVYWLDTFEVGEAQLGWYVNSDRTAEQIPAPDEDPPRTSPILANDAPSGRCVGEEPTQNSARRCSAISDPPGSCTEPAALESRTAIRVRSGNLTANGGQFGRDFTKVGCTTQRCKLPGTNRDIVPGPPEVGPCSIGLGPSIPTTGCRAKEDTSGWEGIVFWARVAPGSNTGIRVRVGDGNTDDKSCQCDPFTKQNDSSTGCDKWGTYLALTPTFTAYFVPFAEMLQGGWGRRYQQLDSSNLFSLGVEWTRGRWDLWIDDIGFYRRRP